jgi:hypothetical protein
MQTDKKIFILYAAKPNYGGWITFTAHLYRGLQKAGFKPVLLKAGNKSEQKVRPFGRGIYYQNIAPSDLVNIAAQHPFLISAMDKHHHKVVAQLLEQNASIVVHDPTEMKPGITELLQQARTVVIRETMLKHLPKATFILHPYDPASPRVKDKRKMAASISRIDFDKHTEIIVKANQQLHQPIDIYGFRNPTFAHFTLNEIDPQWKNNYLGQFETRSLWSAVQIATHYETIVDMSAIKGDGGGTQYTFLEAIDAGANLILNTKWEAQGLLAEYAEHVSDPESLMAALSRPYRPSSQLGQQILALHNAAEIASKYYETITA